MIAATSVTVTHGSHRALDRATFVASDGAVTVLVGDAGSGRTTAIGVVGAAVRPEDGRVLVDGAPLSAATRPGAVLGVHLGAAWLAADLTLESHLAHACALQGLGRRRVDDLLTGLGLHPARHRRVKDATPAMRQRLCLAVALSGDPRNLALDHPTHGLDAESVIWVHALLRATARRGGAVLLTADRLAEVADVADHVVVLERGRVVRSAPARTLVTRECATYVESDHLDLVVQTLRERGFDVVREGPGALVHAAPHDVGRVAFDHGPGLTHLSGRRP